MTGVLAGLADAGQDVTGADLMVGTSAGAAVAAQLGSGLPLDDLFARRPSQRCRPGRSPPSWTWRRSAQSSRSSWTA
jgi:predicted acylesterase/phospholipase RssA